VGDNDIDTLLHPFALLGFELWGKWGIVLAHRAIVTAQPEPVQLGLDIVSTAVVCLRHLCQHLPSTFIANTVPHHHGDGGL
jgi:hypothetical protein